MNADNYSHLPTPELNQLIHDLSRDSRLKYDTRPEMMVWDEGDYVEIDDATGEVTVGPGLRFNTKAPESL